MSCTVVPSLLRFLYKLVEILYTLLKSFKQKQIFKELHNFPINSLTSDTEWYKCPFDELLSFFVHCPMKFHGFPFIAWGLVNTFPTGFNRRISKCKIIIFWRLNVSIFFIKWIVIDLSFWKFNEHSGLHCIAVSSEILI